MNRLNAILCSTALACVALATAEVSAQVPVGTSFQYQGQVRQDGRAATGEFDFEFRIYDSEESGNQVGPTLSIEDVQVVNGLFAEDLDFGPGVFTGNELWLEIAIREGAGTGPFTVLSPRQILTAAPYALRATTAGDSDTLDGLDSNAFLQADGSIPAGGLIVEGTLEVDAILFPDGSTQTTASSLPTVTEPTIYFPAFLRCGSAPTTNPAQWAAVALGSFRVTIDGTAYDVTVNFSSPAVTTMGEVASRIEGGIRSQTGGVEVVQWNGQHFLVLSGNTSSSSSITPFVPHSGGVGIDISGAGATPWTDCDTGTVTPPRLNLSAYSGHLVKLNANGQINPLFTPFPGAQVGRTELAPNCFGPSGFWTKSFPLAPDARYGLVYAVGGTGSQGQLCGLSGILIDDADAVITCRDTGNVSQSVHFTIKWGTCTGSYVGGATQLNGVVIWYR